MLPFPSAKDLRPSPDRVRETVFNWLQWHIPGANCLDLFAGSGAFGFEAASRDAKTVTLVENNALVVKQLKHNATLLGADNVRIVQQDAVHFLRQYDAAPLDIIFLDPPFSTTIFPEIYEVIQTRQLLSVNAKIYIERQISTEPLPLPANWHIIRQTTCGLVQSYLISTSDND